MAVVTLNEIRQPVGETGAELGSVDMGGMSVLGHKIPKGVDYTPLLEAACGEVLCPVPHYFVVTKGTLGIRYTDGKEETARAGDVAYTPPGHTVWAIDHPELGSQLMFSRPDGLQMTSTSGADGMPMVSAGASATVSRVRSSRSRVPFSSPIGSCISWRPGARRLAAAPLEPAQVQRGDTAFSSVCAASCAAPISP